MEKKNGFLVALTLFVLAVFALSYINCSDIGVWKVEITSPAVVFALLLLTFPKFRFSNFSYFIISLWMVLHAIGAHYTFEKVPFDFITNTFGFDRNHFDRLAHFVIGLNSFCFAELFYRNKIVNGRFFAAVFGTLAIMAMANAWELIEWIYAEIDGGKVGAAFLGSQGDIWDAQKDMLADNLGALAASVFYYLFSQNISAKGK